MDKAQIEASVWEQFKVRPGQVYLDNDRRMAGRRVKIHGVTLKEGKASGQTCASNGRCFGNTVWISFKRLATKRLFTLIEDDGQSVG